MDSNRFSTVSTVSALFANRRLSRRQAIATGGAGLAVAGTVALGYSSVATAQDATPDASGTPTTTGADHGPTTLFLQAFEGGTITPKEGAEGRYELTLNHGLGQTVYFSDRPDRIVGTNPTADFLEGLGFPEDNPPNAALVVESAPGVTDIAVIELFAPTYDPAGPTVTYEVTVLADWENALETGFVEAPTDLAALAPTFGTAHLFIDDCAAGFITCRDGLAGSDPVYGVIPSDSHDGFCYSWAYARCVPCQPWLTDEASIIEYWGQRCGELFAECADSEYGCYPVGAS